MCSIYAANLKSLSTLVKKIDKCSATAEVGDRLATTEMGRNLGGAAVPLFAVRFGFHLTQRGLSRGLPP